MRSGCYEIRGRNGPWCFLARIGHAMFRFREYNRANPPTTTHLLTSPTMSRARGGGVRWLRLCFPRVHLIDGTRPAIARCNSRGRYRRIAGHGDGEGECGVACLSRRVVQASQPLTLGPWGRKWVWKRCRTTNVEETVWKWVAEPLIRLVSSYRSADTCESRSTSEHRFASINRRWCCVWDCQELHG